MLCENLLMEEVTSRASSDPKIAPGVVETSREKTKNDIPFSEAWSGNEATTHRAVLQDSLVLPGRVKKTER